MNLTHKPYEGFAGIYDQLMCAVDYHAWVDYVEQLLTKYDSKPSSIIDLACGTGSSTIPFAERGYHTAGVDLSGEMLTRAREKTAAKDLIITFFEQDLCQLDIPGSYDLAVLFQDGLNYITSEEQLGQSFNRIHGLLNPGGMFIFDLTRPKLRPDNSQSTVSWVDVENFSMAWESSFSRESNLWSIKITVFELTESGLYKKYGEEHSEKDYEPGLIKRIIADTGFKLLGLHPSFSTKKVTGNEVKLTFVTQKM